MKYALVTALGLMALLAPTVVRADEIVNVSVSNFTFDGNSVCGSGGTSACTEALSASFQWDNTTNTYVAGSFASTQSGALGSSFSLLPPFLRTSNEIEFDLTDSNNDVMFFDFAVGASGLISGTYTEVTDTFDTPPGTYDAFVACAFSPSTCSTDYPPLGAFSRGGAEGTNGTVTVTPVPEPTSLFLLGTGLLGVGPLIRRRIRI